MEGYQKILEVLEQEGRIHPSWGQGIMARCPAHDDRNASLSIGRGDDGRALIYCHAGCTASEVIGALGLEWSELMPEQGENDSRLVAQYIYTDANGEPTIRVKRYDPKGFSQEHWTGTVSESGWASGASGVPKHLYNLPEVIEGVKNGAHVYIVEGEKDVHTFRAVATGAVATTAIGGAGKWLDSYTPYLEGATVWVVVDRDDPGREGAARVIAALDGVVARAQACYPASGKDATDHFNAGFGIEDFLLHEPFDSRFMNWDEDVPDTDWVWDDVIPRGVLVWAYGATESAKSLCLMGIGAQLSHQGITTTYYGEEMERGLEAKRLAQLAPNRQYFNWLNHSDLDLSQPDQVQRVIDENRNTDLIILDSYSLVFRSRKRDENNKAVDFKRVADIIIQATGATVVVIDHTGKPGWDSDGRPIEQKDPRGASAKRQQADVAIYFEARGKWDGGDQFLFSMEAMKNRYGASWTKNLQVVNTPGGGLAIATDQEAMAILLGKRLGVEPEDAPPVSEATPEIVRSGEASAETDRPVEEAAVVADSPAPLSKLEQRQRRAFITKMVSEGMPRTEAALAYRVQRMLMQRMLNA